MERLTDNGSDGFLSKCKSCEENDCYICYEQIKAVDKLKVYEDLEDKLDQQFDGCISMGEIIDSFIGFFKQWNKDEQIADAMLITNDSARKYREWKRLDERGLLPELPCKVGDTVYTIYFNEDGSFIEESKVEEVSTHRIWIDSMYFDYDDIGKTVFFTQAEAEEALKRMEEENETD